MTWTEESLRAEGFENPKRATRELSGLAATLGAPSAERLHEAAKRTSEPDELIAAFDRSREGLQGLPEPTLSRLLDWLPAVFHTSTFAPRLLATRPGLPRWLAGSWTLTREKTKEQYRREALAATRRALPTDAEGLQRRLRRYKYREFLRLMVRDAALRAPMAELGREQSALAEALIGAALAWAERSLQAKYGTPDTPGFCILGMGKLGGEDLNFSSDVDLIYLYRADGHTTGGTAGALPNVQYFTRLGEAVTQALTKVTAEGFCYRVDLNLRPQGRAGAMVLSLPASLAYYETFGRTWERAALLKARAVAGDATLAEELLSELEPFIWRRSLDLSAVDGLRDMKVQIDMRGKASADDVKLGPGGIREVEFFVNALQLLQGGKDRTLREPRTMRALRKLERAGFVSGPDADALEEAYTLPAAGGEPTPDAGGAADTGTAHGRARAPPAGHLARLPGLGLLPRRAGETPALRTGRPSTRCWARRRGMKSPTSPSWRSRWTRTCRRRSARRPWRSGASRTPSGPWPSWSGWRGCPTPPSRTGA